MSEILVTFSAIQGAEGDVSATSQSINGQLGDLKSYLAPMVSTWTGAAAENYQAKQKQWDDAAAELNTILVQIGKALGDAGQEFQSAETSNANIWA